MARMVECVPNFSEGRDESVMAAITGEIETVDGVELLDVDPGKATNRTVVTFVGEPEAVIESAVRAIAVATELIDMSQHTGEHPRFGATDVCPLVPVAGVTMEETVAYARRLARRLGEELGLVGILLVIFLFGFFCYRGLKVALRAPDMFGRYLAAGCTLLIGLGAMLNMGVVMGILPTKGLALPFISYGGSSLVVSLVAVGILLNISTYRRVQGSWA